MKVFKIKYCSYSVITGLPGKYFEYYVSLVSLLTILSYYDQLQETEVSSTMSPYMQIEENEIEKILQKCSK